MTVKELSNLFNVSGFIKKIINDNGYIYLIYDKYFKRYKIGFTKNIKIRIKTIAQQSGTEINLLKYFEGNRKVEKKIHNELIQYKLKGEWYNVNDNVIDIFNDFELAVLTGTNKKGWEQYKNLIKLEKEASKISRELNKEIRKIPDERFGNVNSYHIMVLEKLFEI